jgi:hypothetical protein
VPTVHVGLNFKGLDTNDAGGIIEPPDPIAAAGPNYIGDIVNSNIAFYNKSTGAQVMSEGLDVFFQRVDSFDYLFSDVYIAYDESVGRWWASTMDLNMDPTAANLASWLDFAVSDTSDPTKGWSDMHQVETDEVATRTGEPTFTDFPRVGWNADEYVVSFNMYGFNTEYPYNAQILTIQKSSVLDTNGATLVYKLTDRPLPNSTMVPAEMHGSSTGDPMWFVEEKGVEQDGTYQYLRVVKATNLLTSTPTFTDYYVQVAPYDVTPFPSDSQGQFTTALDTRILSADYRNGQIVAAQDVGILSDQDVHARWYELDVSSGTPSLVQQGTLNPGVGVDTYMPSAALAPDGSIGMTYLESSGVTPEDMSMYVTGWTPGDTPGTMEPGVVAKAGERYYQGTRAGDFSGVAVDPVTGTSFWACNEYAITLSDPSDLITPNWGTWMANFSLSGTSGPTARITGPTTGVPFQPLPFSFIASDPGSPNGPFTYTVNWGDGNKQTLTGGNIVNATHSYNTTGSFTVSVSYTDPQNFTSSTATQTETITTTNLQNGTLAVGGTAGSDTFTFTPGGTAGSYTVVLNGTSQGTFQPTVGVQIFGGTGNDTAIINGSANNDTFILDPNQITLNGLPFAGNSIENWKANAVAGNDSFLADTGAAATIDGGTGTTILTGPNINNTWSLIGVASGKLNVTLVFSNISDLVGGSGGNTFRFNSTAAFTGTINGGGAGTNTLNYSTYGAPITVNLANRTAPGLGQFSNINSLVGPTGQVNTLIGPNLANIWTITGANSGKVGTVSSAGVSFSAFQNIVGGPQMDVFKFTASGSLSGTLAGGGGNYDWLDYSQLTTAVTVNLATGQATGVAGGVSGITAVTGGSGNDTITGGSGSDIIVGGSGNDVLTGGTGASLLIGGLGGDTLNDGGSNNDLLIASSTSFDTNKNALQQILAEWKRTDETYQQKINHLKGSPGGKNGTNYLTSTTVPDDTAIDTLNGSTSPSALDWFWANNTTGSSFKDTINNLNGSEQVN